MDALSPWHLALILLGFLLLFGYKKLPEASRSLGRSLRIFKSEMRELSGPESPAHAPSDQTAPLAGAAGFTPSAAVLDEQARQAEAEAAQLRSRAEAAQQAARP